MSLSSDPHQAVHWTRAVAEANRKKLFRLERRIFWLIGKYSATHNSRNSRSRTPSQDSPNRSPISHSSDEGSGSKMDTRSRTHSHSKLAVEDDITDTDTLPSGKSTPTDNATHHAPKQDSELPRPRSSSSGSGGKLLVAKKKKTSLWNPTLGSHEQVTKQEEVR